VGNRELLYATFPPGSVTGAPKVQAMRVIAELEPTGREVYTGAVGFASPVAGLELNVAIRTFEQLGDRLWLGAGGGIVAGSDAEQEFEEALLKASPLVAAIGSRIDPEAWNDRPGDPPRPGADRRRRVQRRRRPPVRRS
jgi:anthranilate/para-aminobenzoate synthase component I